MDFAFESLPRQNWQRAIGIGRAQEDIEIFGEAANAGVLLEGDCSRDGEGQAHFLQMKKNLAEEGLLRLGKLHWSRRGNRELVGWFTHEDSAPFPTR